MSDAPTPPPRPASGAREGTNRLVAAVSCAVQALALFGFAVFYVYELSIGEGSDTGRVVMSAVLIALAGAGLGRLAWGWVRRAWWPRTPTILWNGLMLPVGYSVLQAGTPLVGWAVLVVAVVTLVAALRTPPRQPDDPQEQQPA
ncbi:hypothetical protein KC207_11295 [Phycicoccus sp. BSK3Z-2]|uniref:Uncharacterized protein n=1 Tax=Phycicoccus avicenniae TaxID=2828860 RepID=A0A941D8T3_9MICO|nr:hypothetical protein [Phycicoccus avicenniae]MBR7743875.1 hypothetical protein [Phycicoccus avicenniae]